MVESGSFALLMLPLKIVAEGLIIIFVLAILKVYSTFGEHSILFVLFM